MNNYRITFGHIEVGAAGRKYIEEALNRHWLSEGVNVRKFESTFAKKFGYGQAIATRDVLSTDQWFASSFRIRDLVEFRSLA